MATPDKFDTYSGYLTQVQDKPLTEEQVQALKDRCVDRSTGTTLAHQRQRAFEQAGIRYTGDPIDSGYQPFANYDPDAVVARKLRSRPSRGI